MHHNSGRGKPEAGLADMQSLAVAAITALQAGNLGDEAERLHARVLTRAPEALLDRVVVGDQSVWTFKPMVELLLHELRHIATAPNLSLNARRERIHWTLEVAGF